MPGAAKGRTGHADRLWGCRRYRDAGRSASGQMTTGAEYPAALKDSLSTVTLRLQAQGRTSGGRWVDALAQWPARAVSVRRESEGGPPRLEHALSVRGRLHGTPWRGLSCPALYQLGHACPWESLGHPACTRAIWRMEGSLPLSGAPTVGQEWADKCPASCLQGALLRVAQLLSYSL